MEPAQRKTKASWGGLTWSQQSEGAATSPGPGQFAMQPMGRSDLADAVQQGVANPDAIEEMLVDVHQVLEKKAETRMRKDGCSSRGEHASDRTECAKRP